MHVDAFFEYLLDNSHPYWTQIPSDTGTRRDGVAAEDDMALRSLLPQIRPRRGRKRPDDDELSRSPSQRPRMDSEAMGTDEFGAPRTAGVEQLDLWSAQPDVRGAFFFPPNDHYSRMNMGLAPNASTWTGGDFTQTPSTAHPFSAITPSTRNAFWPDQSGEPKSAITPNKSRLNKRHGAKVVSSAWRSGVSTGTGKARGRPPINRSNNNEEAHFSAYPSDTPNFGQNPPMDPSIPAAIMTPTTSVAVAPEIPTPQANIEFSHQDPNINTQPQIPRPPRNRLSLQVPARVGGEVRLATPPLPPVTVNRQAATQASHDMNTLLGLQNNTNYSQVPSAGDLHTMGAFEATTNTYVPIEQQAQQPQPQPHPQTQTRSHTYPQPHSQSQSHSQEPPFNATPSRGVHFSDPKDRTNMDELEAFFISQFLTGDWFDSTGNPIPSCTVDEALAISQQILENVMSGAATKETFLINIAALTGGNILKSSTNLQVYRTEEGSESATYNCHWQLQLGDIKGTFSMKETVGHGSWKMRESGHDPGESGGDAEAEEDGAEAADARHWHEKYTRLLEIMQQQKTELSDFRKNVVMMAKPPVRKPPH